MHLNISDISSPKDLKNFPHWKAGDTILDPDDCEATIKSIAIVMDFDKKHYIVFFHTDGSVGSVPITIP